MKKLSCILLFIAILTCSVTAEEKDCHLSFLVGVNHIFKYELRSDYPVVPAHTPGSFGATAAYFFSDKLGLEVSGLYTFRSKVSIFSKKENENIDYKTADHLSMTANLIYHFTENGRFIPYFTLGLGLDILLVKTETYESNLNNDVLFKTYRTDPMINIGLGCKYIFTSKVGAIFDIRFSNIFINKDANARSFAGRVGIFLNL